MAQSRAPDSALSIRILGRLAATQDGQELDLGGPRQRAVLGILVAARRAMIPASRMIDLVWDEHPPQQASGALQAYVSHLRKRLEPSRAAHSAAAILVSEGSGYALRVPDEVVDAWRFEAAVNEASRLTGRAAADALRDALALWQGSAFADYAGQPWADAQRIRYAEVHAHAIDELLGARLATGEATVLIPDLEAAVAAEPLREDRWRLLALALYRSNRQADALSALRRARTMLSDELGVDPGPALRELEADVLAQSSALLRPAPQPTTAWSPPRRSTVPSGSPTPTGSTGLPGRDELVDRDREVSQLSACLEASTASEGSVVLIAGPAGIGKTRLLTELRRDLGDRALCLTARGSQLEREFAYGAVRQLFDRILTTPADRERLLSGSARAAASVFDTETADAGDRTDSTFAVLNGLYWLVVNAAADRPLVLSVDDLQWCDTGSLRFFAFLAHRLEGLPVLFAATLRTGEEHQEAALLAELEHDVNTTAIRPAPLSLAGVGGLVRLRLGEQAEPAFIAACHRTTSGNPLLVRQLLRALEADGVRPDAVHAGTVNAIGSRAVASLVLMRLARLPDAATTAARAVAVLGDGAELPAVAALAELSEAECASAIAALVRTEMLHDQYPLAFVHPLIREAVYQDVPTGQRQLHHERAARSLDAASASAEQIAAHLMQVPARGDAWVCTVLRQAARTAADRGAPEGAAAYLTRALAEPPTEAERPGLLVELGRAEAGVDGAASVTHLRQAYQTLTDPQLRASLAKELGHVLVFAGAQGEATLFTQQVQLELAGVASADDMQALKAVERTAGHMHGIDSANWQIGTPSITGDGPGARRLAACLAWESVFAGTNRDEAVALAAFALADGVLQRDDGGLFWAVAGIVQDVADVDHGPLWDEALANAHARGSVFRALAAHLWRGYAQWRRGELREAHTSLTASTEFSYQYGGLIGAPYGHAFLIQLLIDRGEVAEARAYYDSVRHEVRIGDGGRLRRQAECDLLLAEGRYPEAIELSHLLERMTPYLKSPVWRQTLKIRARALGALGHLGEALELVAEDYELALGWGAPRAIGRSLLIRGELSGHDGEAPLREAISILTGGPAQAPVDVIRAQLALSKVSDDQDEQVALLQRAVQLGDITGALGLRLDAAKRLQTLGAEVPKPPASLSLTSTERRIAKLTADGAEVREIAEALFLTPHAVQLSLDGIRSRLNVTDDHELGRALDT
ncbi:MAG: Tetratricopeptide 4 [Frankiales bacterium]|nr:Tetratricopeptide 4 [Frankiales bacterium]